MSWMTRFSTAAAGLCALAAIVLLAFSARTPEFTDRAAFDRIFGWYDIQSDAPTPRSRGHWDAFQAESRPLRTHKWAYYDLGLEAAELAIAMVLMAMLGRPRWRRLPPRQVIVALGVVAWVTFLSSVWWTIDVTDRRRVSLPGDDSMGLIVVSFLTVYGAPLVALLGALQVLAARRPQSLLLWDRAHPAASIAITAVYGAFAAAILWVLCWFAATPDTVPWLATPSLLLGLYVVVCTRAAVLSIWTGPAQSSPASPKGPAWPSGSR